MGVPFRNGGLGAAHQALLHREGPAGFQPYLRPPLFSSGSFYCWALCASVSPSPALFFSLCQVNFNLDNQIFSLNNENFFSFTVWIGRLLMETFYGQGPHHELYTAFAGLYFCWLVLRGVHVFSNLVPAGWTNVFNRVKSYTILVRYFFCFLAL